MTTARDIVKAMYRKISVLGQGSELTAEEANDGLDCLNDIIASWSIDGPLIYIETKETFPLTGAESYTIGSGQDFDTTVPTDIKAANITYSGTDYPVQVIDQTEYSRLYDKDLKGIPEKLYFDSNYPVANIYIWPVNNSSMTLTLYSEKPLTEFASLDTVFDMPAHYRRALIHNGAVEIASEHEKEAPLSVKRIAKTSLDKIKNHNKKNNAAPVRVDSAYLSRGCYDIYSGRYR